MSDSFIFSNILPQYSIVNPSVRASDYLDTSTPFTFFEFLKYTNANLNPIQTNDLYLSYIKKWGETKNNTKTEIDQTIQERYIELLKEITLKYSSSEEKRFFSNIDWTDQNDLDIVLPFYSRKIREICDFYASKREKIKHKIEKVKIKGTPTSIEKAVFENITDVLFSDVLEVGLYQKNIDEKELLKTLNIEIEELYDIYTNYLDNNPNKDYTLYNVKTQLRKDLFTANLNDINANIFINFDQAITDQLFTSVRTFLTELGKNFTINYDLNSVNLNCKPDDKLYNLVKDNKPKAQRLVELRNKLIKKYIGCDFKYIETGADITDVTIDTLFKAENPTGNLLNRHFPTTASIEEESELYSLRRIGLFFTPDKSGLLYFSVPEKKYKVDYTKLEPNKLYIFPDPDRYGNTTGVSKVVDTEYPLIHICDYSSSLYGREMGLLAGDIKSTPTEQDFYPYFSRNQANQTLSFNEKGLTTNFSSLYDIGTLTKWTTDIYGNQYGLFKQDGKRQLVDNVTDEYVEELVYQIYDGGPITFSSNVLLPKRNFTSNSYWVYPNVWASDYYYNILTEGGVGGYYKGLMERGLYSQAGFVVDGLTIDRSQLGDGTFDITLNPLVALSLSTVDGLTITDNTTQDIVLNTNMSSFSAYGINYIIDGYILSRKGSLLRDPLSSFKVLNGNPPLSSGLNVSDYKAKLTNEYILSSIKYRDFDAGYFTEDAGELFNFEEKTNFFLKEVATDSMTVTSTYVSTPKKNSYELKKSVGQIFIKDIVSGEVMHLSSALAVQFESKYTQTVLDELYSEVIDFNVYNDFIWIKTSNYMIFDKLKYSSNKFVYSGTSDNRLDITPTNNVSNPFIFENRDYAMVTLVSGGDYYSNNFKVIPIIYTINYKDAELKQIHPVSWEAEQISLFTNTLTSNPIALSYIGKPHLFYNSRNDKYCVVAIIEDMNGFPYIFQFKFNYNGSELTNKEVKLYKVFGQSKFETINFSDLPSLSGNNITINNINNATYAFSGGKLILS